MAIDYYNSCFFRNSTNIVYDFCFEIFVLMILEDHPVKVFYPINLLIVQKNNQHQYINQHYGCNQN